MKLKKVTSLFLIGSLCVAMAACGKKNEENDAIITPDKENTTTQEETTAAQSAAGTEYRDDVSTADIEAAVAEALGENYWPDTEVETLETLEITEDMYEEFIFKVPMISANVDTLIVIKAADGRVADVEEKLNQYRDRNINDLMQYPMNLAKIQCSQVLVMGDYAIFVQFGAAEGSDAVDEAGTSISEDEAAKLEMDLISEQNEIAIQAIKNILSK